MTLSSEVQNGLSRNMLAALGVLSVVLAWSLLGGSPVRSIFPYAFATALVAWRHGLLWGFAFAALACLVAALGGAFPTQPQWLNDLAGEGLMTYLKLSAVAIGVSVGKRMGERRRDNGPTQEYDPMDIYQYPQSNRLIRPRVTR